MKCAPLVSLLTGTARRGALCVAGVALSLLCLMPQAHAQFLFDNTKQETAGSADWVVDTGAARYPTPAASTVTATTKEDYWTGALSAWGVSLAKSGYTGIETLIPNTAITYGSTTNAQDLSHYKVYAIDEPNVLFTASEKTAIITFVQNGGSLLMVSDHSGSDRNNDGSDSVQVWNDLFTNNSVKSNPFGIMFNADDRSINSTYVDTSTADPITHGAAGTVTKFDYNDGATLTISTAANSSVKGAVWYTSAKSSSTVMVAYATYGLGHVVAIGDSSPLDDGTGDSGNTLYDGWDTDSDSALVLNASQWLVASAPAAAPEPGAWVTLGLGILPLLGLGLRQSRRKAASAERV